MNMRKAHSSRPNELGCEMRDSTDLLSTPSFCLSDSLNTACACVHATCACVCVPAPICTHVLKNMHDELLVWALQEAAIPNLKCAHHAHPHSSPLLMKSAVNWLSAFWYMK